MIEEKTIVDRIEILRDGTMQIRLALLMLKDGVERSHNYHRMTLSPGQNWEEQIAVVNAYFMANNLATVSDEEIQRVSRLVPVVHT